MVLRDEVSVHISSFELWVARQPEQEVHIGAQADNLGREANLGPAECGKQIYSEKHLLYDPLRCHVEKGHTQLSPDLSLHIWTYTSKSSLTRETGCGTWDSRGV